MNILYIMHVDWNWVKQRPHFLAEAIDKIQGYTVQVVYKMAYQRHLLVENTFTLKRTPIRLYKFPYASKFRFIIKINSLLDCFSIRRLLKGSDIIYVTHPILYPAIKKANKQKIVYDCMDDVLCFPQVNKTKVLLEKYEKDLIRKSACVIFTSSYLQQVVQKRCNFEFPSIVVHNAIQLPENPDNKVNDDIIQLFNQSNGRKIISYIGTISEWLDYDLLNNVAEKTNVVFYMFGPMDATFLPTKHVRFFGPQKHSDVFGIMQCSDALIMPFVVNDLIRSVNPVKLYEYIYSGKPIISVLYGETMHFEPFVYLYESTDKNSLLEILKTLNDNGYSAKKDKIEARQFAMSNTWKHRAESITEFIESLSGEKI
ncbi:MAG: hypothetical protein EOL95_00900 [Bacteroidia bacterium]|nr:hypothetical protein [Bacteroidia bacterium]